MGIIIIMDFQKMTDQAVIRELGMRLRQRRLDANLTRDQVAGESGLSSDTVRNAEQGANISLESLVRLLRVLGRLDELSSILDSSGPSPVELARNRGNLRQRASGTRKKSRGPEWEW